MGYITRNGAIKYNGSPKQRGDASGGAMFLKYLYVFVISMVPIIELRGAIPVGIGMGLPMIPTYIVAVLGNMVPVAFIYFFAQKFLKWGAGCRVKFFARFCSWCLVKGEHTGQKLLSKGKNGTFVALTLFIGIPLPGTGAWTGTLAASILNMGFKKSVIAAMLGVLLAGVIIGLCSAGIFGAAGKIFAV